MSEKQSALSPPYASFSSFISIFNRLKESGVPSRIDKTVFGNASGSLIYSVLSSLKYLKLIDEEGRPDERFKSFASAADEDRPVLLAAIIKEGYPTLFSDGIDLTKATAGEFNEHLREQFGIMGATIDKVATFFINAAKFSGVEISPHLAQRKNIAPSNTSRKSSKQRKSGGEPAAPVVSHDPVKITDSALEYRLVDLITEAAQKDPAVVEHIIAVVTFLKTKDIDVASDSGGGE